MFRGATPRCDPRPSSQIIDFRDKGPPVAPYGHRPLGRLLLDEFGLRLGRSSQDGNSVSHRTSRSMSLARTLGGAGLRETKAYFERAQGHAGVAFIGHFIPLLCPRQDTSRSTPKSL